MKAQHTLRRALAVLLSLLMALAMTVQAFARGGYEEATMYVDDLGRDAVNLPVTGHTELDLTDKPSGYTFKVYDDGGRTGNCDHVEKDGWLLIEAPENYVLQFAGWVNIQKYRDCLTVYDGDTSSADSWVLENIIYYRAREFGSLVTTGRSMLIHFTGPDLYTCPGFELSVTLAEESASFGITYTEASHGRVYGTTRAQTGATATIFVEPDPGYALKSISVKDANGDNMLPLYPYGCVRVDNSIIYSEDGFACWNVDPLWYSGVSQVSFTMPASNVTVEYEMTPIAEGLSVNLPIRGWGQIVIPEEVQTFDLYDDGGPDGEFSMYNDVLATLVAPDGYRIRVTGTAEPQAGREDCCLELVDAATKYAGTKLVEITGNSEDHDIGTVESSGRYMFLYFTSGWNEDHYAGIDLTVTLIPDDDYGDPVWTWAEDHSSASATFSNGSHTVTLVDAVTDISFTTDPGCETDGIGYYGASVVFGGETYNRVTDEDVTIPGTATGHTYGFTGWSWAADHSSAEATFTCEKGDDSFTLTDDSPEMVTVEPAGCLTDANVKYTAEVSYNGEDYTTESDVVANPGTATGHSFDAPVWEWRQTETAPGSYDRTVILSLYCPACIHNYVYTNRGENAAVKLTVTSQTAPTETEAGKAVCTAKAVIDGKTYTKKHTFVLPATGHDYQGPVWEWAEDHSSVTAIFKCVCGDEQTVTDASPVLTVVSEATATEDKVVRYDGTVTFEGKEYTISTDDIILEGTATGEEEPAEENICKWCGKVHSDNFFQKIVAFFHKLFAAIFGAKY